MRSRVAQDRRLACHYVRVKTPECAHMPRVTWWPTRWKSRPVEESRLVSLDRDVVASQVPASVDAGTGAARRQQRQPDVARRWRPPKQDNVDKAGVLPSS